MDTIEQCVGQSGVEEDNEGSGEPFPVPKYDDTKEITNKTNNNPDVNACKELSSQIASCSKSTDEENTENELHFMNAEDLFNLYFFKNQTEQRASCSKTSDDEDSVNEIRFINAEDMLDLFIRRLKEVREDDAWKNRRFFVVKNRIDNMRFFNCNKNISNRRSHKRLNSSNNKSVSEQTSHASAKNRPVKRKAKAKHATDTASKRKKLRQQKDQTKSVSQKGNPNTEVKKGNSTVDEDNEASSNSEDKDKESDPDTGRQNKCENEDSELPDQNSSDDTKEEEMPEQKKTSEVDSNRDPDKNNQTEGPSMEETSASEKQQQKSITDPNGLETIDDKAEETESPRVFGERGCYICNKPAIRARKETVVCIRCGRIAHKSCVSSFFQNGQDKDFIFCTHCIPV